MTIEMEPSRIVTGTDRQRLRVHARQRDDDAPLADHITKLLADAEIVDAEAAAPNLVTMNSTVVLRDVDSGAERICTLVYPEAAGFVAGGVSVFSTLGIALIGCCEGEEIAYTQRDGQRRLRVVEIRYQPERVQAFHL